MHTIGQTVKIDAVVEGILFQEGAPEPMQGYLVRLTDGQRIHTNARNLKSSVKPEEEIAPDLVPTDFHARHKEEASVPKPRKPRAPSNAKLPSVDRP